VGAAKAPPTRLSATAHRARRRRGGVIRSPDSIGAAPGGVRPGIGRTGIDACGRRSGTAPPSRAPAGPPAGWWRIGRAISPKPRARQDRPARAPAPRGAPGAWRGTVSSAWHIPPGTFRPRCPMAPAAEGTATLSRTIPAPYAARAGDPNEKWARSCPRGLSDRLMGKTALTRAAGRAPGSPTGAPGPGLHRPGWPNPRSRQPVVRRCLGWKAGRMMRPLPCRSLFNIWSVESLLRHDGRQPVPNLTPMPAPQIFRRACDPIGALCPRLTTSSRALAAGGSRRATNVTIGTSPAVARRAAAAWWKWCTFRRGAPGPARRPHRDPQPGLEAGVGTPDFT